MRKKFLIAAAATAAAVAAIATPASAITRGGTLDGDDHPYVGVMVAKNADGDLLWRCSGSLISSTVYVTAGHCTESPAATAEIWFESDVQAGRPDNGYPADGEVSGTTYTHPDYNPSAFYLYDLGVVVLDEPVHLDAYAKLPSEGYVDTLGKGRSNSVVAVGYGLQASSANPVKPEKTIASVTRYQAELMIVNTKGVAGIGNLPDSNSLILSGDAKHGGTCSGDSGGPALDGDILVAVTSFGLNVNCAGIGGSFRIDRAEELAWISSFLD